MGKVYSAPETIAKPILDFSNVPAWRKAEGDYIKAVGDWAKQYSKDKANTSYIGEQFDIPMADSQASYIVYSLKPVALIHLPIGDEWDSALASQVNAKYIKDHIDGRKRWNEKYGKK
jgi:hypothetical protein